MKTKTYISLVLAMLLTAALATLTTADWQPVPVEISVDKGLPAAGDNTIIYTVTVTNKSSMDIAGRIRVLFEPIGDTLDPTNADGITNPDGADPHLYYDLVTATENLFTAGEVVAFEVIFDGAVPTPMEFDLTLELNDAYIQQAIFRKDITKTPDLHSSAAKLEVMPRYVDARNTKGQRLYKTLETDGFVPCDLDADGKALCPENDWDSGVVTRVKPLIVKYEQEVDGTAFNNVPEYPGSSAHLAHDVYAAVSLDGGASWRRTNVSRTARKSSYEIPNGLAYPGDSELSDIAVAGEQVLVTWIDKYCPSGNPWGVADDWPDPYQIIGPQKAVDYVNADGNEDPRPDLGVRPFSCVWAARGVLQTDPKSYAYGTVEWYRAEQLSTGRRDAMRNFTAAIEAEADNPDCETGKCDDNSKKAPGGFAAAWQEDPKGLKPGKGEGPGVGMSGASVNHKADIWYTYLKYGRKFAAIDESFVPTDGPGIPTPDGDNGGYTPYICTCGHVYDPYSVDPENPVKFTDLPDGSDDTDDSDDTVAWVCPDCGASLAEFEKITKPHALYTFSEPVRITDNAVCKERTKSPIMAHVHTPEHQAYLVAQGLDECDYFYEGATTMQPITWDDLPPEWECPKCGGLKSTFTEGEVFVKWRNEGAPYCEQFAGNPRVDKDGNVVDPLDEAYPDAYYTSDEGEPLDGNTGASRPNLALVNWKGQTHALVAYEETKGIGIGSDPEVAAVEQLAPLPLVKMADGSWEAGFTNSDCRSCHFDYVVPRDRLIPVPNPDVCASKGGIWKGDDLEAYFPYVGYPYLTEDPVSDETLTADGVLYAGSPSVPCVKFEGGKNIYPRDLDPVDGAYMVLPEHLPGWHTRTIDCARCHLPTKTKDLDNDGALDQWGDLCLATPEGETVDTDPNSLTYGCSATQSVTEESGHVNKTRHGKNVFYHTFNFADPDLIRHGHMINLPNPDWSAEGSGDNLENARRVRLSVNPMYGVGGSDVTLGILYKEGKDGQGAPADAMLRIFRKGFGPKNLDEGVLNLSSSTPYLFLDPEEVGTEDGTGLWGAGDGSGDLIGNHNTPKVTRYYWTDQNLTDESGYWLRDEEADERFWDVSPYTLTEVEVPVLRANPFDNVFSTRLEIRGKQMVAAFAYSTNWAAARKTHDHYDFYTRTSQDGGRTWSLPVNVSNLKNHEQTVSDCRILMPPATVFPPGSSVQSYGYQDLKSIPRHDFHDYNTFFVAIGTEVNYGETGNDEVGVELETFLDLHYSRTSDRGDTFQTVTKDNPKYVLGSLPYIDNITGFETDSEVDEFWYDNLPNPTYASTIEVFDWLAKDNDAFEGDVQVSSNPAGSQFHGVWQQQPLMGAPADVLYRKIDYLVPDISLPGDVNGDGELTSADEKLIKANYKTTALDRGFLWAADINRDNMIDNKDRNEWRALYKASQLPTKPPVAGFTFEADNLTVQFTDLSTDPDDAIASRVWEFGDGDTSTDTNPEHTYATAEFSHTYTVRLTVTDQAGHMASVEKEVTLEAALPEDPQDPQGSPPVPAFTFTADNLTVQFTDQSTVADEDILSRAWDFGDNVGTSTDTNPEYTYGNAGTYPVSLIVTDGAGNSEQVVVEVTVAAASEQQPSICKKFPWLKICKD